MRISRALTWTAFSLSLDVLVFYAHIVSAVLNAYTYQSISQINHTYRVLIRK